MSTASPLFQEQASGPQAYQLLELLESIQGVVHRAFRGHYWIVAEVVEPGFHPRTRHWYMSLAQVEDGQVVASIRANLWAGVAQQVMPRFEAVTGSKVVAGMGLMLYVSVTMHPIYGLSLTIHDINPEFTLGHLERIKRETIQRLQREGVMDLNKLQYLPDFIQRVAVISSATAAGWGDFKRQIEQSRVGALLKLELFPATMQGEQTTKSIIGVLEKIAKRLDDFDAIVLIRGGGSRMDLSAFDEYLLACHLANFPLPVITGIGHERDESVADLVAHTRLKTPTAVADFLLRRAEESLLRLFTAEERLHTLLENSVNEFSRTIEQKIYRTQSVLIQMERRTTQQLHLQYQRVENTLRRRQLMIQERANRAEVRLGYVLENITNQSQIVGQLVARLSLVLSESKNKVSKEEHRIQIFSNQLAQYLTSLPKLAEQRLNLLSQTAKLYDPTLTMQRGYLPVTQNGGKVTSLADLDAAQPLHISLLDGSVEANITNITQE